MSSISVKLLKCFNVIIRLIPLALPALVMLLFAARWHPAFNAGEFPGAVFRPETAAAYSIGEHDRPPKITAVSEGSRPGLPADPVSPGEIAGAFYRAVREDTENAENAESVRVRVRAPGPGLPLPGTNTGPPDNVPDPADEPGGGTDGKTGEPNTEGWQLLGFIRDSAGVERRYFKERESGKITVITDTPEGFPVNADSAEGVNR
ncbi:MAG: hypothetical protein LBF77_09495 [Spirochaetaceae bacterium]|jgi:hypothetical protein|nr:hypothetical protein [Spirochaetaceae bacterium]